MLLSNLDPINAPMPSLDPEKRQDPAYNLQIAQLALDNASAMGIPTFLLPRDLCQGTNDFKSRGLPSVTLSHMM
jgi:hypothetical protein